MRQNIIPFFNRFFPPLVFLTGLVLRLVIAPMGGHPGDIHTITRWAAALDGQSLLSVYQISDANYPPLAMAMLGAMAWVYHLLTGSAAQVNDLWLILMKLPPILSDLGIGWAVWKTTAQFDRGGDDDWFFQRCVLLTLVVFNPALVYLSGYWGQYESVYMVFTLLAVLLAVRGKPFWAGAAISAGLMVKLQAAVAGPVVVLAILAGMGATQTGGLSRSPLLQRLKNLAFAALGGLLILLLCMGPYVIDGQGEYVYQRLIAVVAGEGWITVNALNGWYLATGGTVNYSHGHHLDQPDTDPFLWGLSARSVGTALMAVWTVMVVALGWWRARGKARGWLLVATLLYMGVFLFPTQVKERYSFGAMVILAGAVAVWLGGEGRDRARHASPLHRQQAFWLYIVLSILHTLNLLWAAPVLGLDEWFAGNSTYGLIVSAGMVVATGWGLWLLIKVGKEGPLAYHDGALPEGQGGKANLQDVRAPG